MTTLLQLKASIFADHGQASQLSNAFVATWRASHPDAQITVRDLARDPVPHLDADRFQAFLAKPEARTEQQQDAVAYSDALMAELKAADVIVLGLPMYNFGMPSTLKAWIDQVARAGITFRYTETGPQGLLSGKKVYVFATRGGKYAATQYDTQTDYMRNFFGFIGITDVEFIYAEGLNMSEENKTVALTSANSELARLAA